MLFTSSGIDARQMNRTSTLLCAWKKLSAFLLDVTGKLCKDPHDEVVAAIAALTILALTVLYSVVRNAQVSSSASPHDFQGEHDPS